MLKSFLLFSSIILFIFLSSCKQADKVEKTTAEEVTKTIKTKSDLSEEDKTHFISLGKDIAQASFKSLSGNLKNALLEGGVSNAVKYCNLAADSLTDSLSMAHNAVIKRTSLKLRNSHNKASDDEVAIINQYMASIRDSIALKPIVHAFAGDKVKFYAPIKLKGLCLTCHGELDGSLTAKNYTIIKDLYPEDEAIGYKDGDFRGIWSILMER